MKSCKKGYYYCNTDEKCKPIPEGSMVQPDGMLVKKDVSEEKEKTDHEVSMAQRQLSRTERNVAKLRKALGKKEKNIPAWVQAKITTSTDKMDSAANYMQKEEINSVSIEDANGEHYADFIDVVPNEPLKPSKGIGSDLLASEKLQLSHYDWRTKLGQENTIWRRWTGSESEES
tara:strand:- start:150 stop:671 length:522 start_codon:yes stop_codon:yes gene_type:complete